MHLSTVIQLTLILILFGFLACNVVEAEGAAEEHGEYRSSYRYKFRRLQMTTITRKAMRRRERREEHTPKATSLRRRMESVLKETSLRRRRVVPTELKMEERENIPMTKGPRTRQRIKRRKAREKEKRTKMVPAVRTLIIRRGAKETRATTKIMIERSIRKEATMVNLMRRRIRTEVEMTRVEKQKRAKALQTVGSTRTTRTTKTTRTTNQTGKKSRAGRQLDLLNPNKSGLKVAAAVRVGKAGMTSTMDTKEAEKTVEKIVAVKATVATMTKKVVRERARRVEREERARVRRAVRSSMGSLRSPMRRDSGHITSD